MASITDRPNKHRWIQFVDDEGKRQTLRLGPVTRKNAEEVCRRVESLIAAKLSGDSLDPSTAAWVGKIDSKLRDRLAKLELIERRADPIQLGAFLERFFDHHLSVAGSTTGTLEKGRDCLIQHFGADRRIDKITKADTAAWRVWMLTEGNRRNKKDKTMADSTVRRRTGMAKQFYKHAILLGYVDADPFEDLPSTVHANEARQHFVEASVVQACIEAAPNAQWRAIIALSRYGGLRLPSELTTLTWDGIDFANGKMVINATKTKRHRHGGRRVCPLFPELRPYLEDLYEMAPVGQKHVFEKVQKSSNLRTTMYKIIDRAGVKPWPKLFQNLRASRETELLGLYPAKDVTSWIGNTLSVAMKHYAIALESSFTEAVAKGAGVVPEVKLDSKGEALAKHFAKQQAAAADGAEPQTSSQPMADQHIMPPSAAGCSSPPNGGMGDTGFEPVTPAV